MQVNTSAVSGLYEFGPFRLDPVKRILRRDGEPVPLTPKAFDTLLVLVQSNGRPLSREDLMQAVWPDSFVEEANLTQNIFVLRKALGSGDRYIVTLPGRGYQFVEQVREVEPEKQESKKEESAAGSRLATVGQVQSRWGLAWVFPLLALLALATGAGLLLRFGRGQTGIHGANLAASAEAAGPARRSLAVLGFRNSSGRPDEQWISTAFSEMLNTELAAGNQLRMVSGEDVARTKVESPLPDVASLSKPSLQRLRGQLGADMVVLGSYTTLRDKKGERIRFDLRLQDTSTGETIAEQSATGTRDQLFELVTEEGSELRQKIGIASLSGEQSGQVRASVAANGEATRLYAEGLQALRGFDALGARQNLEKAIAADPSHALSHSALAEAWSELGYDSKAQQEAKRAFELSKGLSRADHLLVEGRYQELVRDYPRAIEIYQTLCDFFPDDVDDAMQLARAQIEGGRAKDALQTIAKVRGIPEPQKNDPRIDLAEASAGESLGDFRLTQRMAATAEVKAQAQGSHLLQAQAKESEGWAWDELGDYQKAASTLAEARNLFAAAGNQRESAIVWLDIGDVFYDRGQYSRARNAYEQALGVFRQTGAQQKVALTLSRMGSLFYDQGMMEEARRRQQEALRIDREIGNGTERDLSNLGNVLEAMGDLDASIRMRQQAIAGFEREGDKADQAVSITNLAGVLLKRGRVMAAKQAITRAIAIQEKIEHKRGLGFSLFFLTEIERAQDQLQEARATTERNMALRTGLGDQIHIPETQLQLAEICLDEGKAQAAESLARDAAVSFEKQNIDDLGAEAYADISRALLAGGKLAQAQSAADRALILSKRGGDLTAQFDSSLAQAGVRAAAGQISAARKILESVRGKAIRLGYGGYELETGLRRGELETQSGNVRGGRQLLRSVEQNARAKGFLQIAHQAQVAANWGLRR